MFVNRHARSVNMGHIAKTIRIDNVINPFNHDNIAGGLNSDESILNYLTFEQVGKLISSFPTLVRVCENSKNIFDEGTLINDLLITKIKNIVSSQKYFISV
jgi:hypothetical protein